MNTLLTPEVIEVASASNLGILSLMILVLGGIALAFFRHSATWVKLIAFVLLFAGVIGFGYAIVGANASVDPFNKKAQPQRFAQTSLLITHTTGTGKNHNTDAIVSVTLVGAFGSHSFKLDNQGNDREQGKTDTYQLSKAPDIGPLREAIFYISPQKGQDYLDDWYVTSVTIVDNNRQQTVRQKANQWLGDGTRASLTYTFFFANAL